MKVLLLASNFESGRLLMHEIKQHGDHFIETVEDMERLCHEIARTTPHLLVVHAPVESDAAQMVLRKIQPLFPGLPVCLISGDLSENRWQAGLREVLAKPIKPETPRPYAHVSRTVHHDESLKVCCKGKLNQPEKKEGWEKTCSHQEARFVLQLQTAKKNHAAAKHYFACLSRQQADLDQEVAYRLAHGSYKGLSWSRDLACKWLALLAHYIADAELEYLPQAGTPGPNIDFVHHDASVESRYAATLLILYAIKPTMIEAIKQLVTTRFEGQDDDALLATSLRLYGMAKMLQQVGRAQIELMDAWLDPAIVERANDAKIPRGEHRNAGIYRDFYDLGFIVSSPEPLASVLRGFHAGTTFVEDRHYLPSFAEFRQLCRAQDSRADDGKCGQDSQKLNTAS